MLLAKLLKLSEIIDNTMNLPSIVGLGIKIRYSGLSNETAYVVSWAISVHSSETDASSAFAPSTTPLSLSLAFSYMVT